ncbi:hypothetical protein LTR36_006467 [Oleoguttula mirabilis]|uniref:non-specific serine/threonine protein kinase n=1 Tax=Oleoguttula mirabilis TaxID=1507867 RepID=A0AAV9JWL4_9PEZI|nr:hypothetical protein LTR36_006467 [Oleoguttula mirabilis]
MVSYGLGSPPPSPTPSPVIPGAIPKSPSPSFRGSPSPASSPTGVRKRPTYSIFPRCPHVPKKRGRLGRYQGKLSLPIGREFPGQDIKWSSERPENGDVWCKKDVGDSEKVVCREHLDAEDRLDRDSIRDVESIMNHPNLVNLKDHSGFGQLNVRKETAWEICDAGTLNSLILAHGDGLPESLIWHTLVSLLQAVRYLNTGRSRFDDRDGAAAGWKPIVHNAINPANIFYCQARTEPGFKTPTYGRCKLGNFSRAMAIESAYDDVSLLELYEKEVEGETTGYEAPDLSSHKGEPEATVDEITGERKAVWGKTVGSASDVWSIGAVAVAMMTGDTLWPLVMREYIKIGMEPRRYQTPQTPNPAQPRRPPQPLKPLDWRTVSPAERFERLKALTEEEFASKLWNILPFTYSDTLKLFVESMLGVNPWTRANVQDKLATAKQCRAETWLELKRVGDEMLDEYVEEGEPDLPYDPTWDSD